MTILSPGDIAIVGYNSDGPDSFTFVFLRDVDAGTTVSFTDNGWLASGGFRAGEGTVTYTAATAISAFTTVTLTGLDLDPAGDQIIAYSGDATAPNLVYAIDFADDDNAFAADATSANTSALPAGLTLGLTAVAIAFDNGAYTGPASGSQSELLAAIGDPANWSVSDFFRSIPPTFFGAGRPEIDLDFDNSTHGGRDYRATYIAGGAPARISDIDIRISDSESSTLESATIKVGSPDAGDLLSVSGLLPGGIVASVYDPVTGILTLSGTASLADYETAVGLVQFSSTSIVVGDQKRIEVTVFAGPRSGTEAKAFITAVSAGARASLDLDANDSSGGGADATATFTQGGPPRSITDVDVLITDPDSTTLVSANIVLAINRFPDDVVSINGTLPAGITASAYDPSTGVLTLTGAASLADYQTALRQVVYSSSSASPSTADRIFEVTVNDGGSDSNVARMFMHVVAVANAPPVLNLDADSSPTGGADYLTTFTDGGAPVAIADVDVSIIDSDSPTLASATITLSNPHAGDVLTFNGAPPPGITASAYDPATGVLTLAGSASPAAYQTALRQITFDNPGTNPDTDTRIIHVVVNDGIAPSNIANSIVQVVETNNSAPVLDLDQNNSTAPGSTYRNTFTENGAPVAIADGDTSITDLDSTTLASARITLTNPQTGDVLAVDGTPPAGITFVYDPATSTLTLTGTASLADYQTSRWQVRFSTAGDEPVAGDRIVQVVVNDGVNDSNAAAALVAVVPVNDPPAVAIQASATYVENTAAVALSPLAGVTDADDPQLTFASVEINQGSFSGDGDVLTIAGATSGAVGGVTFLWDPTLHTLVFNGAAPVATYQDLLRQIEFHSTSDNPTDFNASPQRTLLWTVSDGTTPQSTTTTIDIVARNDAPVVAVAATAAYMENDGPTTLSPAASVTDPDSLNLTGGQVVIVSGALPGDVLTVNGLQSGTFAGIAFSFDPATSNLFFRLTASVADYQAFFQAAQFQSTSDDPTNGGADPTRTVAWAVLDGFNFSTVQTTTLTITDVNDAPLGTITPTDYGPVDEQALLSLKNSGISVADPDAGAGGVTATLSVSEGILNIVAGGSGAIVSGGGTSTVTISGTADQISALLNTDPASAVDYVGISDSPSPNVTLQLQVNDNGNTGAGGPQVSAVDTAIIHVTPLNDPPAVGSGTAGASNSIAYTEQAPPVLVDDQMTIVDPDSVDMVGATLTIAGAVAGDLLHFTNTANITGTYDPTTFTLTGLDSIANYEAALQSITFDNPTNDDPTNSGANPTRTVTWQVDDGTAVSNASTTTITFTAVNDAPVNTVPGPQSIDGTTPHAIAGLAVSDADAGAGILTTTLSVAHGTLAVASAGGAAVAGSGTGMVTLTGTVAQINTTLGAPDNVIYTGAPPAADDALTMQTSDGGNTGTPGPLTDTDTIALPLGQEPLVRPLGGGNFDADHSGGYLMRRVDGTFLIVDVNSSQATVHILGDVGTEWTFLATGDFNGDGISDVLSQRVTDQMLHIHTIDGDQVVANWFIGAVGAEWKFLGTGDFNNDGTSDL